MAIFCVLYFQRSACSQFQTCILNSHSGHTMCGSMVDIQLPTARWIYRTQKSRQKSPSVHHRSCTTVSGYIFASQLRHVSTIGKNLLSISMSCRCPHNMVNFGPLAAEIGLPVWGTPANFNGFRVLAALLHGSQLVGVSQTLRHWTEAGRPWRWALVHIIVSYGRPM